MQAATKQASNPEPESPPAADAQEPTPAQDEVIERRPTINTEPNKLPAGFFDDANVQKSREEGLRKEAEKKAAVAAAASAAAAVIANGGSADAKPDLDKELAQFETELAETEKLQNPEGFEPIDNELDEEEIEREASELIQDQK